MFFSGAFCSAHAQLVVDDIEIAAEFQPHLMQSPGVGEAEFLMQADARRVAARDDGNDRVRVRVSRARRRTASISALAMPRPRLSGAT